MTRMQTWYGPIPLGPPAPFTFQRRGIMPWEAFSGWSPLSFTFNLVGACVALDTACSSSLVTTHLGVCGTDPHMISGGANLMQLVENTRSYNK
mmetsp:Transcript_6011/g.13629  ORF Transcript_6011/g.13629 Transcript_6011/m.13629 type:complete len:93 (+) Transcript_6011:99-377(+)